MRKIFQRRLQKMKMNDSDKRWYTKYITNGIARQCTRTACNYLGSTRKKKNDELKKRVFGAPGVKNFSIVPQAPSKK